ncbi:MAG: hypothetical protein CMJ81_06975 [Planctomycetaceae bacterium]|nr:hypothetical protein [Planctomycetaceae bacterium]MBP61196.1 hypothetical protein [Planctomycetaceae bacterium]
MAIEIVVPRLGWSMEKGNFVEWLKRDGEMVEQGDMLFVLEGEKAAQEIESFDGGILRIAPDAPQAGDEVVVGQLLGYLVEEGEQAPCEQPEASATSEQHVPVSDPTVTSVGEDASGATIPPRAGPAIRRLARDLGVQLSAIRGTGPAGRITTDDVHTATTSSNGGPGGLRRPTPITPRARRVARELGVDWRDLQGSGKSGRIREQDVRAAVQSQPPREASVAQTGAPALPGQTRPISSMRRTIAERMLAGVSQAAPVTLTTKADATNLVALREQFKVVAEPDSVVPGYTDFLIKLTAAALRKFPALCTQWTSDGLVIPDCMDVAVAVDTEDGLLAPVIRGVDGLTVYQISTELHSLASRARARSLAVQDLQGGVFTLTNLGAFHIDAFTPILNLPQSGILGVGRIVQEPVVFEDQVVARHRISLSLTFDHRVVDGAPAARFLDWIRAACENPGPRLM